MQDLTQDLDKVLAALFQNAIEGILVTGQDGTIYLANDRVGQMFGYGRGELVGQAVEVLIPERQRSGHVSHRKTYHKKPKARPMGQGLELVARHQAGTLIPVEISLNPIEVNGLPLVVAHIIDITTRTKILGKLEDSQFLLASIINEAVDGIITIDEAGLIESLNPAAALLFGYDAEEVIGKNVKVLMPEPHRSSHDGYIKNYRKTGVGKIIGIGREVEGRKKNGKLFPFRLSISEVNLKGRRIFTGIVHDLTEEKIAEAKLKKLTEDQADILQEIQQLNEELENRVRARTQALDFAVKDLEEQIKDNHRKEAELRKSQEDLQNALAREQELNEMKSNFVSMASHEFRTPLATILSSLSLAERYLAPEQTEKREKHYQRIRSNVHLLTSILNDFLSLSKLEEGKTQANPQQIFWPDFIQETIEQIQLQAKQGQEIQYEPQGEIDFCTLDPALLKNVLFNLLSNAIKYSPPEKPVRLAAALKDDRFLLEVHDQGMGIPEEEQKHLFERFFRARNATHIQGTGLGLSIVYQYVQLMKGEIRVESKEGEGTSFWLSFPKELIV